MRISPSRLSLAFLLVALSFCSEEPTAPHAGQGASAANTALTESPAELAGLIAFVTDRDGDSELYLMDAAGSRTAPLTVRSNFNDSDPAWSRDGRKLAFTSYPHPTYPSDIYSVSADGSELLRLTNTLASGARNGDPSWSPDGERIVFVSNRDGGPELYMMNADGSGQMRLTTRPVREIEENLGPAWSPGTQRIVYRSRQGGRHQIHSIQADGTRDRNLSNNAHADD